MARLGYFLSLLVVLTLACSTLSTPSAVTAIPTEQTVPEVPTSLPQNVNSPALPNSALVDVYDPARNPADDLAQAILVAQAENKRILLELGGDWCIWCKYMDEFYATHPDILQYRVDHYVLIKVNVSEDNMNEGFLSQYPTVDGYPHIFILESDGTFLHSQDTAELEDGNISYVPEVFMAFLEKWAKPSQ
jgi:thiol:disulfide interchange protein